MMFGNPGKVIDDMISGEGPKTDGINGVKCDNQTLKI